VIPARSNMAQNDFIEGQDEPKQIKKCLYIDAQKGIQVHML
jgi:hypothetical protein